MITTSVGDVKLGQVAALSFDSFGNLIILHRGSRVWDSMYSDFSLTSFLLVFHLRHERIIFPNYLPSKLPFFLFRSFDVENNLQNKRPIAEDVILVTYSTGPNSTLSLRNKYGREK